MPPYAEVSKELFASYARKHSAEYVFEENPQYFRNKYARYYNALRPIFDSRFHNYDHILFVDMDVVPLSACREDVFESPIEHIGMVEEVDQPELRSNMLGRINAKNDKRWARIVKAVWGVQVPLDELGRPKVFNSGVVLYTKAGLNFARNNFPSVRLYQYIMTLAGLPRFYRLDQNYLGAFIGKSGCGFSTLSDGWNSQVTSIKTLSGDDVLVDQRNALTKFVHMQHRGKNKMNQGNVRDVADNNYHFD